MIRNERFNASFFIDNFSENQTKVDDVVFAADERSWVRFHDVKRFFFCPGWRAGVPGGLRTSGSAGGARQDGRASRNTSGSG